MKLSNTALIIRALKNTIEDVHNAIIAEDRRLIEKNREYVKVSETRALLNRLRIIIRKGVSAARLFEKENEQ